jgi:hypothetical protein
MACSSTTTSTYKQLVRSCLLFASSPLCWYIGRALAVYLMGPGWTIFSVQLFAWILIVICLWQRCPNLLSSESIVLITCFGQWALVSFVVILLHVALLLNDIHLHCTIGTVVGAVFTVE